MLHAFRLSKPELLGAEQRKQYEEQYIAERNKLYRHNRNIGLKNDFWEQRAKARAHQAAHQALEPCRAFAARAEAHLQNASVLIQRLH